MELGPLSDDIDLTTGRSHGRPGLGPCGHRDAEPVRLLLTDELVAWLCPRCDTQLPPEFQPPDPLLRAVLTGAMSPDEARTAFALAYDRPEHMGRFGG